MKAADVPPLMCSRGHGSLLNSSATMKEIQAQAVHALLSSPVGCPAEALWTMRPPMNRKSVEKDQ